MSTSFTRPESSEPVTMTTQQGTRGYNGSDLNNGTVFGQEFVPKYRGSLQTATGRRSRGDGRTGSGSTDDHWAIKDMEVDSVPWSDLTTEKKVKRVVISVVKLVTVMTLLYFFICSLDVLSKAFQLVAGDTASEILQENEFIKNPVVGVMIGILTTVMVQSSSTSTSIIVSMVASEILTVELAIPIVMGANIGTSITNTIVSLTQAGDRAQFRRAFAGATVHDMFNWLSVIVLLIVEVTTGYLLVVTDWMMDGLFPEDSINGTQIVLLTYLTEPFVELIVKVNKNTYDCWNDPTCHTNNTYLLQCAGDEGTVRTVVKPLPPAEECNFLFHSFGLSDLISGVILLIGSLLVLCLCLILIVKVLQSVMSGQIANIIRKTLNAKIPYVPWITGYLALLVGAVMTFLVQSSSVFTSTLTPLVGLGVISVERVYPLTLGSNIGTTTTALLASLAVTGDKFKPSLQIALCHLLFNVSGILIFYPIPFMRFPIGMSKFLGETTAKYRWFAIAYMIVMFVVLPAVTMGLSLAGTVYVIVFATLLCIIGGTVLTVNFIRKLRPSWLPGFLQDWKFLPLPLRSLEPYDRIFTSWRCCRKLKEKSIDSGELNAGFDFSGEVQSAGKTNNLSLVQVDDLRPPKEGQVNAGFRD